MGIYDEQRLRGREDQSLYSRFLLSGMGTPLHILIISPSFCYTSSYVNISLFFYNFSLTTPSFVRKCNILYMDVDLQMILYQTYIYARNKINMLLNTSRFYH